VRPAPDVTAHIDIEGPLDLIRTTRPVGGKGVLGSVVRDHGSVWRAERTAAGAATLRLTAVTAGVRADAWGPGAGLAVARAPGFVGALDDPSQLRPRDMVVSDLTRRFPGHRLTRTATVWEHLPPTILGQKVPTVAAERAWQGILRRFGERPPWPAPDNLVLAPTPRTWCQIGYFELHRFGVERKRATIIARAARRADRLEEAAGMDPEVARRRLRTIDGIGPWTAAFVTQLCHGDPDAVIVGDYNLPHHIAWVLTGERKASDERMLELLEPYRGQRARVQLLIKLFTRRPPRRGPRLTLPDFAGR